MNFGRGSDFTVWRWEREALAGGGLRPWARWQQQQQRVTRHGEGGVANWRNTLVGAGVDWRSRVWGGLAIFSPIAESTQVVKEKGKIRNQPWDMYKISSLGWTLAQCICNIMDWSVWGHAGRWVCVKRRKANDRRQLSECRVSDADQRGSRKEGLKRTAIREIFRSPVGVSAVWRMEGFKDLDLSSKISWMD